jgi:hypothetical protein
MSAGRSNIHIMTMIFQQESVQDEPRRHKSVQDEPWRHKRSNFADSKLQQCQEVWMHNTAGTSKKYV